MQTVPNYAQGRFITVYTSLHLAHACAINCKCYGSTCYSGFDEVKQESLNEPVSFDEARNIWNVISQLNDMSVRYAR